ncbi:Helicase SKI2W, partial [Fragariocoptes setiger]
MDRIGFVPSDYYGKLEELLYDNVERFPLFQLENLQQVVPYQLDPCKLLDVPVLGALDILGPESRGTDTDIVAFVNGTLSEELKHPVDSLPGTNLKHQFDHDETHADTYLSLASKHSELLEWIESESKSCESIGTLVDSVSASLRQASLASRNKKDNTTLKDKETQDFIASVLEVNIKGHDLIESKSTEFAKVINIAHEPDEEIINPAKVYPFKLDPFQKQAIIHMEKYCNVFVAAHTSAGKTVVAEYAIAMARRSMTKVVYTSPIKALSNQKYRDFSLEFGDVGLITGDVQVNTGASCLVLTTEILLQMLDNGSDLIRDLEWVIFDEVHYVNDKERGHVWETLMIRIPSRIRIIMLSATVPNVIEFADWVGFVRQKQTIVITTAKRPVPLEHYLYTGSNAKTMNQRFKFIDSSSEFVNHGYVKALESKKGADKFLRGAKGFSGQATTQQEKNIYITLIRHLEKALLLPVICFTFSRKRCDNNSKLLQSIDLTTQEEKARIHKFVTRSLDRFKESDRKLRQVVAVKEMLKRGFGVHHSGILPLLKEITEILFCDGLVKVLFATETFSMGVNMPARCVVFDSIIKHDGERRRNLLPAEYIQMAGRAGRRGKDDVGTVIVLCKNDVPEASDLVAMTLGDPTPLESRFQLKYSMILTLLRARHHLQVESVIGKSFIEHNRQSSIASRQARQRLLLKQVSSFKQPDCDICLQGKMSEFCEYYINFMSNDTFADVRWHITSTALLSKRVFYGRTLVLVGGLDYSPGAVGVIVQAHRDQRPAQIEILCLRDYTSGKVDYVTVNFEQILLVYKARINANWTDLYKEKELLTKGKAINKAAQQIRSFVMGQPSPLHLLKAEHFHARDDLDLRELDFTVAFDRYWTAFQGLKMYDCWSCPQFITHFQSYYRNHRNLAEVNHIAYQLSPESLVFLPEYKKRLCVLRELDYINVENVPELKAKVACLMSVHELVITEMLTENLLTDCTPAEIAALLSAFVYQAKKVDDEITDDFLKAPKTKLERKCKAIVDIATKIGEVQVKHGLDQPVGDFVEQLNFGLVDVVQCWAEGVSFSEILRKTEEQEGIIVRCIQRLDEVLRAVKAACKLVGYPDICERIEVANQSINRDIVFAASLYVCATLDDER